MTTQLATPLRAEPDLNSMVGHWLLLNAKGEVLARKLTKQTAALIVGMSEDAGRLDWILKNSKASHGGIYITSRVQLDVVIEQEEIKEFIASKPELTEGEKAALRKIGWREGQ